MKVKKFYDTLFGTSSIFERSNACTTIVVYSFQFISTAPLFSLDMLSSITDACLVRVHYTDYDDIFQKLNSELFVHHHTNAKSTYTLHIELYAPCYNDCLVNKNTLQ